MRYKKIPKEYIKVILDRLFRLKPAYERYERVFCDILNKFLIKECEDKVDLSHMSIKDKAALATEIFNSSAGDSHDDDVFLHKYIKNEEKRIFKNNPLSEIYLNTSLNLKSALKIIENEPDLKFGVKQMLTLINLKQEARELRRDHSLLYPIEKIVLCEGATEEILLEKFCAICGYDFKKEGVYVLGAGGKNQVARKYYDMTEEFNIPVFVLLDADATATKELIEPKLRKTDGIYIIKSGEFEDILPKKLIINALNYKYNDCFECHEQDFHDNIKTAKELFEIFKQKGFGTFKKADFAKTIKEYLDFHPVSKEELTQEIKTVTRMIESL